MKITAPLLTPDWSDALWVVKSPRGPFSHHCPSIQLMTPVGYSNCRGLSVLNAGMSSNVTVCGEPGPGVAGGVGVLVTADETGKTAPYRIERTYNDPTRP